MGSCGEGAATNALRPKLSPNKPGGGKEVGGAGGQAAGSGGLAAKFDGLKTGDYNGLSR